MIPTKQTVLHDPENGKIGNCLSAVLASLLHLPIEEVPVFADAATWRKDLNTWLKQYGLAYVMLAKDGFLADYGIEGVWHEISGDSPRRHDVMHACVAKDGEVVFDPHPDDSGLVVATLQAFFISLEPWKTAAGARTE